MSKTPAQQAVAAIKASGGKATHSAIQAMVAQMTAPAPKEEAKKVARTRTAAASVKAKPVVAKFDTPIKFIVNGNGVVTGGGRLFAHTAAWLDLSGMLQGKEFPAHLAVKIGGSALNYHKRKGNFSESQGMVKLTERGMEKFGNRELGTAQSFDPADKDAFVLMMMTGINDERLIKNAKIIVPIDSVQA